MHVTRRGFGLSGAALYAQSRAAAGFYGEIVRAADASIAALLDELAGPPAARLNVRRLAGQAGTLAAAFAAPESSFRASEKLIAPLEKTADILLAAQHSDGTIDSGNYHSPPDTGFVLEPLCAGLTVLRGLRDGRTRAAEERLGRFIQGAAEALVTGGVHTPNHRWVIASALARIHALFPSTRWVDRINDWLGEGIYIDADGQYPERSTGIYSRVENTAFITMARLLKRDELLQPVRRNLDMTAYYAHADGEIETVGSRRQDQNMTTYLAAYYLEYRYMAVRDRNPVYAAVARFVEQNQAERVTRMSPLVHLLEEPLLREPLPEGGEIPSAYAKVFANSGIARIRRGARSATVFGGSDWPLGVASGLASNPSFFTFRKGKAVLESVRMGGMFFSEGAFRSSGLQVQGGRYRLAQRLDVPYYQPLVRELRNPRGDYALTPAADGRFWSKLDFPRRKMSNLQTLDQRVEIVETDRGFDLAFNVTGLERVPFTVELSFRPGGKFEGNLIERVKDKSYLFKDGTLVYRVGGDAIEVGPGARAHELLELSGHTYTAHGGALRAPGVCVYVTGFTPFVHTLHVGAS